MILKNYQDSIGKHIDDLVKERTSALNVLFKVEKELIDQGAKLGVRGENGIPEIQVKSNYLPQFSYHLEEFEWLATYEDGTQLRQYDLDGQHNYSHIDQSKLRSIEFISNFEGENDNQERKLKLSLNWKTGEFTFINLSVSQEQRSILSGLKNEGEKKLILFKRTRYGEMIDTSTNQPVETGEIYFYKRYYLGYETGDSKTIICLMPNGKVEIITE